MIEPMSGSCDDRAAFMAMAQQVKTNGDKMFTIMADERLPPLGFVLSDGALRLGKDAFVLFARMATEQGHKGYRLPIGNPAAELN